MAGPVATGSDEFAATLASFVKENRIYGAAAGVVHGDELAWSAGAGLADAGSARKSSVDTLYRIASITKTFTGTAIMQLRDAGQLDLDDPVGKWIIELADSARPEASGSVTIRRLLSHESGLVSEPPGTDWSLLQPLYEGLAERNLARAAEIFTAVPPNTQWKYSNLGYQLLGEVVQRVSGTPYPQYLQERILDPLGMTVTSFEPLSEDLAGRCATGYSGRAFSDELDVAPRMPPLWAEGGLWSSVKDLARWASFQLGPYAEPPAQSPVLAPRTLREMHKPRYLVDDEWKQAWCVSWYAVRRDDVIWTQHSGGVPGFATNFCFDAKSRVAGIVLLNGEADASQLAMDLAQIGARLVQASPPENKVPTPMPEQYKPLLGIYASPQMSELLRLEWRDSKLQFVDPNDPIWRPELEPTDNPDQFKVGPGYRPSGEVARFRRLASGVVESVFVGGGTFVKLNPPERR
jgi:CubicO group peptidase (beta-lactamase class C family)